eukprot:Em0087g8a
MGLQMSAQIYHRYTAHLILGNKVCQEYIAPTMWRCHMNLHAQGVFPGEVPTWWLEEQDLSVCTHYCLRLVAVSHFASHLEKCPTNVSGCRSFLPSSLADSSPSENPIHALPSLEVVCELQCPTIRYIPHKARPAFARVLSDVLKSICYENSEEAWLRLFMLPKCVLRASRRGGRLCKHPSIEQLCSLWSQEVWDLLRQKHPRGPHPSLPVSSSPPVNHVLPHDFNILSVLHSFPKGTACGPSRLRIEHLLDAAQVHLPTPICSSLRGVVDILASGRAPVSVSKFLAGGSLTALVKNKERRPLGILPIIVGEALRRLTGKCLCISSPSPKLLIFSLLFNMESPALLGQKRSSMVLGAASRKDDNFTVCKVDMSNAFNLVSRQALLEECAVHFPELLPWVHWCYGSHPTLWHPLGHLHKLVLSIAQDKDCLSLLSNRWYLDDGVLSGHSQAVTRAVTLIQEMGPSLGLFINVSECELFGHGNLFSFPPEMKVSRVPNLEILGAPIGDPIFCAKFLAQKRADAAKLLSQLTEVGAEDPQVAFLLLRQCAAFCKLVHLARSTPPSYVADGLALFDKDVGVNASLNAHAALDTSDIDWMQAQLSLSRGGLGLRSLACHSFAAYLASLSSSGFDKSFNLHLSESIALFNELVPAADSITEELLATSNLRQHTLSSKIEDQQFRQLFDLSS